MWVWKFESLIIFLKLRKELNLTILLFFCISAGDSLLQWCVFFSNICIHHFFSLMIAWISEDLVFLPFQHKPNLSLGRIKLSIFPNWLQSKQGLWNNHKFGEHKWPANTNIWNCWNMSVEMATNVRRPRYYNVHCKRIILTSQEKNH